MACETRLELSSVLVFCTFPACVWSVHKSWGSQLSKDVLLMFVSPFNLFKHRIYRWQGSVSDRTLTCTDGCLSVIAYVAHCASPYSWQPGWQGANMIVHVLRSVLTLTFEHSRGTVSAWGSHVLASRVVFCVCLCNSYWWVFFMLQVWALCASFHKCTWALV